MFSRLLRTGAIILTTLAIAAPNATAQNFVGGAIPDFNTPTNLPGTLTSTTTITASDGLTIGDLAVQINGLTHTWVGDLIATITHTDSAGNDTVATLFNRVGRGSFPGDGDSSNFDGDYVFASTGASLWEESAQGSSGNGTQTTIDNGFVISPGQYANVNSLGFDNNTIPGTPSQSSLAAIFGGLNSAGVWTLRLTDNDANDVGSFASANLIIAEASAVPEPGTFGLMAVASIGGFLYVRRKKKSKVEVI